MKRIGFLYSKIYDIENLRLAHKNASKGKGWYKEVQEINKDPDKYLKQIQQMLINKTFKTSPYQMFEKKDGEKIRKIYKLPYFPDRIVQWAIMQVIEPYLVKNFTKDTYSAISERGIHAALGRIKNDMYFDTEGCEYCLKFDIRHYYQCINHRILKKKFRRLFKDQDLLELLDEVIDSIVTSEDTDLAIIWAGFEDIDTETGIPIGNYLSQFCGNFYLSSFDHFVKEVLKVTHYYRYMDDIVIFAETKEQLHKIYVKIKEYLLEHLKLYIKPNWQIFPTYKRGVDFVGYRLFKGFMLLRRTTCKHMKEKLLKIRKKCSKGNMVNYSEYCSINSYIGWTKHCDSFRLENKYIRVLSPHAEKYYNTVIKKGVKAA